VVRWIPTRVVYHLLPIVLVGAFVLIAALPDDAPWYGVSAFGLAGLGCSALLPLTISPPAIEDRSMEVLTLLGDRGQHRAPSIPDLIIAATAELAGLTVLHLDKDFEIIANVTGQPLEPLTTA
jgi:hypothetical protein